MEKEQLNKIVTGFQFNLAWLIEYSNFLVTLSDPQKLVDAKSDEQKFNEILKPAYMLFVDCLELAKQQDTNIAELLSQPESDTSDTEKEGG